MNSRSDILEIYDFMSFASTNDERILYLKGLFGVGKSHLLNLSKEKLFSSACSISVFDFKNQGQAEFIYEFAFNLAMSSLLDIDDDQSHRPNETFGNRNLFFDKLNSLYTQDKTLYDTISETLKLQNVPAFLATKGKPIEIDQYLSESDIAFFYDSFLLSVESFIADLVQMHLIYLNGDSPEKINLLFIIDDYDKIAGSVNNWFAEYLLPYFDVRFDEYKYYEIKAFESNKTLSDFFNVRVISAGRESFGLPKCHTIVVEPFGKSELDRHLLDSNISIGENFDFINQMTNGLPYIINLVAESILIGEGEIQDMPLIQEKACKRVLGYLSPDEADYLRSASFFNEFDELALRFLPLIKDRSRHAWNFFNNSEHLCDFHSNGKIVIKPFIRFLVKNQVAQESQLVFKSLESISSLYETYHKFCNNLEPEELEIIKQLVYFNSFDKIETIQEFFGDKAAFARRIIEKYPLIFNDISGICKVDSKTANLFLSLDIISNNEFYLEMKSKVESLWQNRLDSFTNKLDLLDTELVDTSFKIEILEKEENAFNQKVNSINDEIEILQREHDETEELVTKHLKNLEPRYWMISLTLALLGFVAHFIFDDTSTKLLESIFVRSGLVALIIASYFLFKYLQSYPAKDNIKHSKSSLQTISGRLAEQKIRLNELNRSNSETKESLTKLNEIKNKIEYEINNIKLKIKEPFPRED